MNLTYSSDFSLPISNCSDGTEPGKSQSHLIPSLSTLHEKEMDSRTAEQTPLAFRGLSPVQLHRYTGVSLTFLEDI